MYSYILQGYSSRVCICVPLMLAHGILIRLTAHSIRNINTFMSIRGDFLKCTYQVDSKTAVHRNGMTTKCYPQTVE
jgi:hypothetical protein